MPHANCIPMPQQNFVSSGTLQSNLTQIPSHLPANGLPTNGVLTHEVNPSMVNIVQDDLRPSPAYIKLRKVWVTFSHL